MTRPEAEHLRPLRESLKLRYPRIADRVSDSELLTMLEECRDRLGAGCVPSTLIACAVARAADVASERMLGDGD